MTSLPTWTRVPRPVTGPRGRGRPAGPAWLLTAIMALAASANGLAQDALQDTDARCLTCHSMPALSKTLADGDRLSLHVPREDFAASVHAMFGCAACHADVNPAQHPSMRNIESQRAYAIEKSGQCRKCHADVVDRYGQSVHASLVNAGNPDAPVCTSCHDPHAVTRGSAQASESGEPCKACHEDVFDAYSGSVHGKARLEDGKAHAPLCMDCHQAHDVSAVASGDRLKAACLGCHENAVAKHTAWLPNAAQHLESVSCPACHSPMAERAVELMLVDRETRQLVTETLEDPRFQSQVQAVDKAGDGLDPMELWALLSRANDNGAGIGLRGRVKVPSGPQAHQLAIKLEAVRACETCHQSGAAPFQNVSVSVTGADGRRLSVPADSATLTSVSSVDSVRGFYTAGGTRIRLLDALLVLAVLAGIGIPLVHMLTRRLFRKRH